MKISMRKGLLASFLAAGAFLFSGTAFGDPISTSAACPGDGTCDSTVSDSYSYLMTAATGDFDSDGDTDIKVTVKNTSPNTPPEALIDAFWFNMKLAAGETVSFSMVSAGWTVGNCTSPASCKFDYTGDANKPGDRLGAGGTMSFVINFADGSGGIDAYLAALTGADKSAGTGIGGGNDSGQVCVSFQQLGDKGEDSDLLCSNWGDKPPELPEPGTLGLLGIGLLGMGLARRRRRS